MPRHAAPPPRNVPPTEQRRRLLIIGPVQDIPEVLGEAFGASALLAPFSAVDAALLVRAAPDMILASLIGTDHDIADLAERLSDLGYRGLLRCYSRPVPRRADILAAMAEAFPDITVEIVEVRR